MLRREHIVHSALGAGFTLCGVARARVLSEHGERFSAALAASGQGALSYLVRGPQRRLDPSVLLPGARTVVVCALAYDGRPVETPAGLVSAHRGDGEYQPRIKAMLGELLERLRCEAPELRGRACCDTAPILEKAWATEAGLGWIGRNSLLINPEHGSFLLLGELLLDAPADRYDAPYTGPGCGACRLCVDRCPASALVAAPETASAPAAAPAPAPAAVDTRRCISARTIERERRGGSVEPIHGWIHGCDECQTCCPYQKKSSGRKKNDRFF